ncbi:MAG: SurA N-terminal domain-containing protein [Desulfovibrionaceae bacterium]|nr:SurA N-terminal domain-containing protein [Desulfovibrionaceae bacterium]
MLDIIRNSSRSLPVKIAFGIIILVFVFWGVGNLVDTGSVSLVAKVNDSPITYVEFERQYMQAEENILQRQPTMKREMLKEMGLGQQVFQQIAIQELLKQEAARTGITISPLELHKVVSSIPAFQTNGKFDPAVYKRLLEAQRTTPGRYEGGLTKELLSEKLMHLMTAAAYVSPDEARQRYNYLRETRTVEYIAFPAADFMATVKLADDAAKKFYDEHLPSFAVPAKIDMDYLLVAPETLVKPESLAAEQVQAWYEKNKQNFATPESVKAAHILIALPENAPEADVKAAQEKMATVQAALAKGKKFAELAKEYSDDKGSGAQGGELGWIVPGQTVPTFEQSAFATAAGTVSQPVRSQFGLHLIFVEEKKPAGMKSFAEVEHQARAALAAEQGNAKLREALDALQESILLGKSFDEAGKKFDLTVSKSGLKSAAELQTLGISAKDAATLIATPANVTVDMPIEAGENRFMLVKVSKAEKASTADFESVKKSIEQNLKNDLALQAAMEKAAAIRKELAKSKDLPADMAAKLKIASGMSRQGEFAHFMPNADVTRLVFQTTPGLWLPSAYSMTAPEAGMQAVLVRVKEADLPSDAEYTPMAEMMQNSLVQERQQAMFQAFVHKLFSDAKIEVLNPDVISRKGR